MVGDKIIVVSQSRDGERAEIVRHTEGRGWRTESQTFHCVRRGDEWVWTNKLTGKVHVIAQVRG